MNYCLKILFATLVFALMFIFSYSQPVMHTIELRLDSNKLVEPVTMQVRRGDTVKWVKADANLQWFRIIGSPHPLRDLPTTGNYVRFGRPIRSNAPVGEWKYDIKYKIRNGPEDRLDPKIAVNPIPSPIPEWAFLTGCIILALLSILFYRKWQKAEAKLRNK